MIIDTDSPIKTVDDSRCDSDTHRCGRLGHGFSKTNKFNAMRKRIREIVILDDRPFSFVDFKNFEVNGKRYGLKHGVIRNYLSKLTRSGEIEFSYNSGIAFYTLPGRKFIKRMTGDHVEDSLLLRQERIRKTPIYRWLKNRRFDKQALHDIRATFEANGIWVLFCKIYANLVNNNNQDLRLPSLTFFEYLDIGITIHHSDMVSISIGCSYRPIALDVPDILQLIEALTRTEVYLTNEIKLSARSTQTKTSWWLLLKSCIQTVS